MTMTHSHHSRRRLDLASLLLLLVGIGAGVFAYWLVADQGFTPLVIVPAIVAATVGASHLVKREAIRHD